MKIEQNVTNRANRLDKIRKWGREWMIRGKKYTWNAEMI